MSEAHTITCPSQLAALTKSWSNTESPAERNVELRLRLLKPLEDPELLAKCQSADHRGSDDPGDIFLNLQALSTAWRTEWKQLPTDRIANVTFEVAIPKNATCNDEPVRINWCQGQNAIWGTDVSGLIFTLATVMNMRSQGQVQFGVDHSEMPNDSSMEGAHRHVAGIKRRSKKD